MSQELLNRVSKNLEHHIKNIENGSGDVSFPRSRLSEAEWQHANQLLLARGFSLSPDMSRGGNYMRLSRVMRQKDDMPQTQVASDLAHRLKQYTGVDWEYKTSQSSGLGYEHFRIKIEDMSHEQAQYILDQLDKNYIYDANAIYTNKGQFLIVRVPDPILASVLGYYKTVTAKGVPAYVFEKKGLSRRAANAYADKIMRQGEHYATTLNKAGDAESDYIVVAIKKSDAQKLGCEYIGDTPILPRNNTGAMQRLKNVAGKPLTHINGVPVVIKSMSDFGVCAGRPVVLVSVGDKKLPFYISSGSAGKTDVPVGKWEFFGGVDETGWFRKGSLQEILSHYNSAELKQIADELDGKIGDLRDSVDVLKTIGRQYLGGRGEVAKMIHGPEISIRKINQSVFRPDNEGIFYLDLQEIKAYLRGMNSKRNLVKELNQGSESLKTKIISRITSLFKEDNSNK